MTGSPKTRVLAPAQDGAPVRRMRAANTNSSARAAIIRAAERLFAVKGIEGASLREIAVAAGHGNNRAVQYHFGSKDELIWSIISFRNEEMDARRGELLKAAVFKPTIKNLRATVEAYCLPILDIVDGDGIHTHAAFLCRYSSRNELLGQRHVYDEIWGTQPNMAQIMSRFGEYSSHLEQHLATSRVRLCMMMFYSMVVRADSEHLRRNDPAAFQDRLNDTFAMITAALLVGTPSRRKPKTAGVIE